MSVAHIGESRKEEHIRPTPDARLRTDKQETPEVGLNEKEMKCIQAWSGNDAESAAVLEKLELYHKNSNPKTNEADNEFFSTCFDQTKGDAYYWYAKKDPIALMNALHMHSNELLKLYRSYEKDIKRTYSALILHPSLSSDLSESVKRLLL